MSISERVMRRIQMITGLRSRYRRVFDGRDGDAVLADLAKFCKVGRSSVATSRITGAVDTHATMLAEGRREVFLHIAKVLRMTDEQINEIMEREHERTE
ncbi:hypothetical protein [Paenalcaligenes suwonensis]|uniref:Bbp19 family protein n=1 Tax=Paenalcaligenes suwonensis TaxID=1202713 RepID=UPI00140D20ED|nr:hypothetical protein [Paenalcaligenes suwonensis]NHC63184.1 hypothetical protein [Paenalcaligenes suwonensis]